MDKTPRRNQSLINGPRPDFLQDGCGSAAKEFAYKLKFTKFRITDHQSVLDIKYILILLILGFIMWYIYLFPPLPPKKIQRGRYLTPPSCHVPIMLSLFHDVSNSGA